MEGLLIRRTLELDCPADELWRLVSEPDEVASWLGRDVELDLRPGGRGRLTDDDGTVRLPFDTSTGQLIPELWDRWLAWDPVRMVPAYAEAMRGLTAIWIDAGNRDEWYLDIGAQAFVAELAKIGVTDVRFELFDATHMAIDYRYPLSLAFLAEKLSP